MAETGEAVKEPVETNGFGVTIAGHKEDFDRWTWDDVDESLLQSLVKSIGAKAGNLILDTITKDMSAHLWSYKDGLTVSFACFDGELRFSIALADLIEGIVPRGRLDPEDDEIDNVKYAIRVLESAVTALRNTLPTD